MEIAETTRAFVGGMSVGLKHGSVEGLRSLRHFSLELEPFAGSTLDTTPAEKPSPARGPVRFLYFP